MGVGLANVTLPNPEQVSWEQLILSFTALLIAADARFGG